MKTINYLKVNFPIYLILILFFTNVSCDSFVDIEFPESQLTGMSVFENETTADAAMANIYANIRDYGLLTGTQFGLSHHLAVYTDEMEYFGDTSNPGFYFYNNSLLASSPQISEYWNISYSQIYAANAVIEGVGSSVSLSQEQYDRLKGEALFVRALLHFYLANLYGDIPYVTTTDYLINSEVNKIAVTEIYSKALTDLEESIDLLGESYHTTDRARPNKFTAMALKARIFLYTEEWAGAEEMASEILNNSVLYNVQNNLEIVFLKDSEETIWQLPPATDGHGTHEAVTFTVFSGPPTLSALTESIINSFNAADLRKIHWIGEASDGNVVWYYPHKYKQTGVGPSFEEASIIFRLPEIYLIRAEARANTGNLAGAKSDLNTIRTRAGLDESTATNQQEILEEIYTERKLEFFTELGHRFFDLKRSGKIDEILSVLKPGWNSTDKLFPIPQGELIKNPNLLPQNPGY